jgi:hypothetical protein
MPLGGHNLPVFGGLVRNTRPLPFFVVTLSLAAVACDFTGLLPALPQSEPVVSTPFWTSATLPSLPGEIGPWAQGPASLRQSLTVGNVEVTANDIRWPADRVVLHADAYPVPGPDEQFAMVDVSATCRHDANAACSVSALSFRLSSGSGETYAPVLETSFEGLSGLFEGGQISPGDTRSGSIVFLLNRGAERLTLTYYSSPNGSGPYASFILGP